MIIPVFFPVLVSLSSFGPRIISYLPWRAYIPYFLFIFVVVWIIPASFTFRYHCAQLGDPTSPFPHRYCLIKLLVSLDSQNFSFCAYNSFATFLVVWLAWVAQFACPWLDNGSSIPFRQPSWNYNASYFLNLSLDCDRQFAFWRISTCPDLGSFWWPQHSS